MAKSDAIAEKWNNFKHAFTSRKAFMDAVEVEPYLDSDGKINNWRNVGKLLLPTICKDLFSVLTILLHIDLSPTPPEKRSKLHVNNTMIQLILILLSLGLDQLCRILFWRRFW